MQINGKIRQHLTVPTGTSQEQLIELALADEKVKAAIEGKQIVKSVAIPEKLVNLVVK